MTQGKKMSQTANVGLDIGYGDVKVVTDQHQFSFPAYTALVPERGMLSPDMQQRIITLHGNDYVVGDDAKKLRKVTEPYVDSARIQQTEYTLLALNALRQIGAERVNMTVGLPVRDLTRHSRQLKEVVQSWSGVYGKVYLNRIVPQPLGSFLDIVDKLGQAEKETFSTGKVAVFDFGSGTIDLIEINEGEFNPGTYSTDAFAVAIAMKLIRNQLQIKYSAEYDISEIPALAERGEIVVRGKTQQITKIVADARRHVIINAIANAQRLWGSLNSFRYIVFSGGGARFLEKELAQFVPAEQLLVPDDPAFSNARGFHKFTIVQSS